MSERDRFSIDLFIADAASGQRAAQLTSTATDPHYSSMQFIHSAGGWDAASRRLAVAHGDRRPAGARGLRRTERRKEHEYRSRSVDEIFNPTWAPDSSAVAFTGLTGGLDRSVGVRSPAPDAPALTNDAYAELKPAWSPDGRQIAFATDRFSSICRPSRSASTAWDSSTPAGAIQQVGAYGWQEYQPAVVAGRPVGVFHLRSRRDSESVSPHARSGTMTQLTDVATGISGIAASARRSRSRPKPARRRSTSTTTASIS